jgi:hypothetical protein
MGMPWLQAQDSPSLAAATLFAHLTMHYPGTQQQYMAVAAMATPTDMTAPVSSGAASTIALHSWAPVPSASHASETKDQPLPGHPSPASQVIVPIQHRLPSLPDHPGFAMPPTPASVPAGHQASNAQSAQKVWPISGRRAGDVRAGVSRA